jgi:hypothetical protein
MASATAGSAAAARLSQNLNHDMNSSSTCESIGSAAAVAAGSAPRVRVGPALRESEKKSYKNVILEGNPCEYRAHMYRASRAAVSGSSDCIGSTEKSCIRRSAYKRRRKG